MNKRQQGKIEDPNIVNSVLKGIDLNISESQLNSLKGKIIVIKYGGNAMLDESLRQSVISDICKLKELGAKPVIVHGGGPFIKEALTRADIKSEFIEGHRKTTLEAIKYVEMALKGEVNSLLVRLINNYGQKAVGISGKDGKTVIAKKRYHELTENGETEKHDLGQVGDVDKIDTSLIELLLKNDYVPIIAPISIGNDGKDYNINADMFAGHLAGALNSEAYIAMTDVDGLMTDKDDPDTLVREISLNSLEKLIGTSIQGGMIPKIESCSIALKEGVKTARIINGTKKHSILKELLTEKRSGTLIND